MSGGEWDYRNYVLEDMAKSCREDFPITANMFQDLCDLAHSLDYYLSGDTSLEIACEEERKFIEKWTEIFMVRKSIVFEETNEVRKILEEFEKDDSLRFRFEDMRRVFNLYASGQIDRETAIFAMNRIVEKERSRR